MKNRILLVEDNEALLFNTQMKLEMSDYEVFTATNGIEALELLEKKKIAPDLIISDIMMPLMDGYALYQRICDNENWNHIPFIFVTAKSAPEDIRFGKKLGVDDYIIKPFKGEDLIASIEGRLAKSTRNKKINQKYEAAIKKLDEEFKNKPQESNEEFLLFLVDWDEAQGPILINSYPPKAERMNHSKEIDLEMVGVRLYNTSMGLYDSKDWSDTSAAQFHITYLNMDAVLVFASVEDKNVRGGQRLFMVVALAKSIHYLISLRLQEKLQWISEQYKKNPNMDFKEVGAEIAEILR